MKNSEQLDYVNIVKMAKQTLVEFGIEPTRKVIVDFVFKDTGLDFNLLLPKQPDEFNTSRSLVLSAMLDVYNTKSNYPEHRTALDNRFIPLSILNNLLCSDIGLSPCELQELLSAMVMGGDLVKTIQTSKHSSCEYYSRFKF